MFERVFNRLGHGSVAEKIEEEEEEEEEKKKNRDSRVCKEKGSVLFFDLR